MWGVRAVPSPAVRPCTGVQLCSPWPRAPRARFSCVIRRLEALRNLRGHLCSLLCLQIRKLIIHYFFNEPAPPTLLKADGQPCTRVSCLSHLRPGGAECAGTDTAKWWTAGGPQGRQQGDGRMDSRGTARQDGQRGDSRAGSRGIAGQTVALWPLPGTPRGLTVTGTPPGLSPDLRSPAWSPNPPVTRTWGAPLAPFPGFLEFAHDGFLQFLKNWFSSFPFSNKNACDKYFL